MDKPSQKAQAVLKLLNTLGRKTIKEDFGLDSPHMSLLQWGGQF